MYSPERFEVPEIQKLYRVRETDLAQFRQLWEKFYAAMTGEVWKLRTAVQFFNYGHTEKSYWKNRYFLWMAGIEALVASDKRGHKEQHTVITRINHLLGADWEVYSTSDFPSHLALVLGERPLHRLGEVMPLVYSLRNSVIHGHKVDDDHFSKTWRITLNGPLSRGDGLIEVLGMILRSALLKVLEGDLNAYTDELSSRRFWIGLGLYKPDTRNKARHHEVPEPIQS